MSVALSDVALAAVAAIGHVGEAQVNGAERVRYGNDVYGAYGTDSTTGDDERIYAVGISPRQWSSLLEATEATEQVAAIAGARGLDFRDEGHRFEARDQISAAVAPWIADRPLSEVAARFDELGVCWGRYQSFLQLVDEDPRCSTESELFRDVDQLGIGTYLSPGSPVAFDGLLPTEPAPAPLLGQHTDEILAAELGLSEGEIGRLHDEGIIA